MTQTLTTAEYRRYSPRPSRCPACSKPARKRDTVCRYCGAALIDPDDADSLRAQAAANKRYMDAWGLSAGYLLVDPLTSARTTRLADRPEGARLLELVEAGRVQHVVCQRLDRIFRNSVDGILTDELFRRHGVTLHLSDEGGCTLRTDTATGRMLFRTRLSFAEFEPDLTSERMKDAVETALQSGRAKGWVKGGKVRFGFKLVNGQPEPDPEEQAILDVIRANKHRKGLVSWLNRNGYRYRGSLWARTPLRRILERMAG